MSIDPDADEPDTPRLLLLQLPMKLPIRKDGTAATQTQYLNAVAHSGAVNATDTPSGPSSSGRAASPGRTASSGRATPPAPGAKLDRREEEKRGEAALAELKDLAELELGTLVVRRSGRVALEVGGFLLEVQPGTNCTFDQEVVAMRPPTAPGGNMDLHQLGKLQGRLVATPNLDQLLAAAPP